VIKRFAFIKKIASAFEIHPIVALLGPRQCGKTTLARQFVTQTLSTKLLPENYFDLERTQDLARLQDPELALSRLEGLVVIDEIQRRPNLFSALRVLVDSPECKATFLILGSSSRELISQSSESLAGRIQYIELTPLNANEILQELPLALVEQLWERGGFPRSFLATSNQASFDWRDAYIRTFLEQDIPALGVKISPLHLGRFWQMLTHYHGNIINYSDIGRSLDLSHNTIKHYIDLLQATFMIRVLQPWHENISKRQVKSPKIYFRDSGILHALMNLATPGEIMTSPKLGASWEGWALEEVIRFHQYRAEECFFWATHANAELDLLLVRGHKRIGFEFKYSSFPSITKSMIIALETLKLDLITIVYPGTVSFSLSKQVIVASIKDFLYN